MLWKMNYGVLYGRQSPPIQNTTFFFYNICMLLGVPPDWRLISPMI